MEASKQARRLLKLAEVVERYEDNFNMGWWFQNQETDYMTSAVAGMLADEDYEAMVKGKSLHCGTAACLGGWAMAVWPKEARKAADQGMTIEDTAAAMLGYGDAFNLDGLFSADAPWQTGKEAAEELRRRAIGILEDL